MSLLTLDMGMTAEFIGEFDLSPYPDGKTWFLLNPITYRCADGKVVEVPTAFETDFASVPKAFQNVFAPWGTYGPASIVHDWLYWVQIIPRERADAIFLEAMTVLNVEPWKRRCLYLAVRAFGESAWDGDALIAAQGYSRIGTRTSSPVPEWTRT